MSTTQIFQESIKTAIFGMGLVLSTLFVLSLVLDLMRVIFTKNNTVKKNEVISTDKIIENDEKPETKDDTELIAVITAALSQYLEIPISAIKVGTIRQIHTKTPAWGLTSRIYNINNKL